MDGHLDPPFLSFNELEPELHAEVFRYALELRMRRKRSQSESGEEDLKFNIRGSRFGVGRSGRLTSRLRLAIWTVAPQNPKYQAKTEIPMSRCHFIPVQRILETNHQI